jgi:hypothetical protein
MQTRLVAQQAAATSPETRSARISAPSVRVAPRGRTLDVVAFTVVGDRIAGIDVIADPEKPRGI